MTPLEQIDFVFFYIRDKITTGADWGYFNIWIHVKKTPETGINKTLLDEIIFKLIEDGLLTEINNLGGQKTYHITFKGLTFNGYVSEQSSLQMEKERLKILDEKTLNLTSWTTRLTLIIAFGTAIVAIYYLLEILNHWLCIYP
jgi:hypothetical protein